jgi:hypothetical protein
VLPCSHQALAPLPALLPIGLLTTAHVYSLTALGWPAAAAAAVPALDGCSADSA